jgi:hypothetical protein
MSQRDTMSQYDKGPRNKQENMSQMDIVTIQVKEDGHDVTSDDTSMLI